MKCSRPSCYDSFQSHISYCKRWLVWTWTAATTQCAPLTSRSQKLVLKSETCFGFIMERLGSVLWVQMLGADSSSVSLKTVHFLQNEFAWIIIFIIYHLPWYEVCWNRSTCKLLTVPWLFKFKFECLYLSYLQQISNKMLLNLIRFEQMARCPPCLAYILNRLFMCLMLLKGTTGWLTAK